MATPILINNNNKIYAECIENLMKAEALIEVALKNDLSETSLHTIHDCLWAISDFIKKAKQAVETLVI
jgi:hypothetical protein